MRAALLFLSVAACTGLPAQTPRPWGRLAGHPMPRFEATTIDGTRAGTESAAGKVTVVKFFAKYCVPCKKTLPEAERIASTHADVQVIGIAEDEQPADVAAMVRSYGLTFAVIHDRGGILAGRFGVTQIPATLVADTSGRIVWAGGPEQSVGDLSAAVEIALHP
jgi:cytochrome c biogenesis protein CcmG, thiol:disulfide interchange protein DsbE